MQLRQPRLLGNVCLQLRRNSLLHQADCAERARRNVQSETAKTTISFEHLLRLAEQGDAKQSKLCSRWRSISAWESRRWSPAWRRT